MIKVYNAVSENGLSEDNMSWIQYSESPSMKSYIIKKAVKKVGSLISKNDLQTLRKNWDSVSRMVKIPHDMRIEAADIGGVNSELIIPANAAGDRVIIYLHGGGYVLGSLDSARSLGVLIAKYSGVKVLSAGYRLAPEHPFPAALDDSLAVYRSLLNQGILSSKIILIGDSAGGGLSFATVLALKSNGEPLPAGVIGLSPWTDLAGTGKSMNANLEIDPLFCNGSGAMKADSYADKENLKNPLVSPLYGDFYGFPNILIHAGSDEILLDDSIRLAEKARESGVDVTLKVWKGMWHVFTSIGNILPESRQSLKEISEFIKKCFA